MEPTSAESTDLRGARMRLMHLLEPQDHLASLLVAEVGPMRALEIIDRGSEPTYAECLAVLERFPEARTALQNRNWARARDRWASRRNDVVPTRLEEHLARSGAWLVTPEDEDWPARMSDLGWKQPLGLWGRGDRSRLAEAGRASVALVGSRDATSYGTSVTSHLAGDAASKGLGILSGGAFGIDAAAHRAALATAVREPATVAFLACGIDRVYPQAHEQLLRSVTESGLVLTELAPGCSPMRHRFLQRNRLIAALSRAVVVVEARWRSGALNTAHHALELGRPVGAVPGSVFSAQSAGCHRLLQEQPVSLVASTEDLRGLLGPGLGAGTGPAGESGAEHRAPAGEQGSAGDGTRGRSASTDLPELSDAQRLALDALPVSRAAAAEKLCSAAGLGIRQLMPALSALEVLGLAAREEDGRWRRSRERTRG